MSVINISRTIISQIQALSDVPADYQERLLEFGIRILEGDITSEQLTELAGSCGVEEEHFYSISQAAASLFWEFAKGSQKDSVLADILGQLSLGAELTDNIVKVYRNNKVRISNLKDVLALSSRRFKDLTWRLDVELARRNMSVLTEPKFMLRLDTMKAGHEEPESLHLQADYANMKKLQNELQKALKEFETAHCQRLARYMS